LRPARLVVVDQGSRLEQCVPPELTRGRLVNVPPFKKWEVVRLAREYCTRTENGYKAATDHPDRWSDFVNSFIAWAKRRAIELNDEVLPDEFTIAGIQAGRSTGMTRA
jgi:hypothetical protein